MGDVGLLGVGDDLRLDIGVVGLLGVGDDRRLRVGDVGLPGVGGVGVPEGESSLPCLLRLHPLQPGPAGQKCLRIFCDSSLSYILCTYLHEMVGDSLPWCNGNAPPPRVARLLLLPPPSVLLLLLLLQHLLLPPAGVLLHLLQQCPLLHLLGSQRHRLHLDQRLPGSSPRCRLPEVRWTGLTPDLQM